MAKLIGIQRFLFVIITIVLTIETIVSCHKNFKNINSDEISTSSSSAETIESGFKNVRPRPSSFLNPRFYRKNSKYRQFESENESREDVDSNNSRRWGLFGLNHNGQLFRIPETRHESKDDIFHTTTISSRSSSSSSSCGIINNNDPSVKNNYNESIVTSAAQVPWQVGIFTNDDQFLCSGVLVSSRFVATAAICLLSLEDTSTANLFQVRLGSSDLNWNIHENSQASQETDSPIRSSVSKVYFYPEMNIVDVDVNLPEEDSSKIALLQLTNEIDLVRNPNIKPICLDESKQDDFLANTVNHSNDRLRHHHVHATDEEKGDKKESKAFKYLNMKLKQYRKKSLISMAKSLSMENNNNNNKQNDDDELLEECYVSGWGLQTQTSVEFLNKQLQKRDLKTKTFQSSLSIPIVTGGKYILVNGPNNDGISSDEMSLWSFQPKSSEDNNNHHNTNDDVNEVIVDDDEDLLSATHLDLNLLGHKTILKNLNQNKQSSESPNSKQQQQLPSLDPVQDYMDSLEKHVKPHNNMNSDGDVDEATDHLHSNPSMTRKKQLKPEYYDEEINSDEVEEDLNNNSNHNNNNNNNQNDKLKFKIGKIFKDIESDELLVDKQETAAQARLNNHLRMKSPSNSVFVTTTTMKTTTTTKKITMDPKYQLKWAPVTLHNVTKSQNVDFTLGSAFLKHSTSKNPFELCMVDIGSPIICNKKQSNSKPSQKYLAGIVTWKMPCFVGNDDVILAMDELDINYSLTQVTPIHEFLDFVLSRIKLLEQEEKETIRRTSSTKASITVNANNAKQQNFNLF